MVTAHQQHLQQSKLYHRLPQEKSEYCQQIGQRKTYQSLVRPSLEYSSAVYMGSTSTTG